VANSETGQCLAFVAGSGQIIALDYGMDGAHLYQVQAAELPPHGVCEMGSYLALTNNLAEARLYRHLEQVNS
jgi:hypothetical protein